MDSESLLLFGCAVIFSQFLFFFVYETSWTFPVAVNAFACKSLVCAFERSCSVWFQWSTIRGGFIYSSHTTNCLRFSCTVGPHPWIFRILTACGGHYWFTYGPFIGSTPLSLSNFVRWLLTKTSSLECSAWIFPRSASSRLGSTWHALSNLSMRMVCQRVHSEWDTQVSFCIFSGTWQNDHDGRVGSFHDHFY